jgi:hypothetical protein
MFRKNFPLIALIFLSLLLFDCRPKKKEVTPATLSTNYEDLVSLFKDWREFQKPKVTNGVPDYTAAAMKEQRNGLEKFRSRLNAIDCRAWPISQQVDYHIVRAEMNGLDFDHRVLRPWSRNPCFYVVIEQSPSDMPVREGPIMYGMLCLWELKYKFPLPDKEKAEFRMKLQAIPKILEQAKGNLFEEAKDLWFLGIRKKKEESVILANLAKNLAEQHPDLVPEAEQAKAAVDDFRGWLEKKQINMTAASGIGIENYNWYMKNVHLVPYTWEDQLVIIQNEMDRAGANLKLEEHGNRNLPELEPAATEEEYRRRLNEALNYYIEFLRKEEICTVPDYMYDALKRPTVIGDRRLEESRFIPPSGLRETLSQLSYRDSLPMQCHGGIHWPDFARMIYEPHPSLIRREPLLYDIWDCRCEGLATANEEMMMHAGLFDKRSPRLRELVYLYCVWRGARAMGDLKMHSNEFSLEDAINFACEWTPYGLWTKENDSVWFDESLYLNQPFYGASYIVGKVYIEKVLADCGHQQGKKFNLKKWWDEFQAAGLIPVSLIRWQMTGLDDEIKKLW